MNVPEVAVTAEMLDAEACRAFWRAQFRPEGACCPGCRVCLTGKQVETWRGGGRVRCNGCGKYFTWRTATPLARKGADERQLFLLAALASTFDLSPSELARYCGMSDDTVRRWLAALPIRRTSHG